MVLIVRFSGISTISTTQSDIIRCVDVSEVFSIPSS